MRALRIKGRQQGPQLTVSDISTQTGPLPRGAYKVYATCDVFVKVDAIDASGVTTLTGDLVPAYSTEYYQLDDGDRIGVIADTGVSGQKFIYHLVDEFST